MLETDLLVGMVGWDRDDWVGGFYPDDLPEDWRLGFYTNRLRAVLVPQDTWQVPGLDVSAWRDDLYPEFRMVLEWALPAEAPVAAVEAFLAQHESIMENVDAYLVTLSHGSDATPEAIDLLNSHRPVCPKNADDSLKDLLKIAGTGRCWLADSQPLPPAGGSYLVALTGCSNPRTVRDTIEKIDAWGSATGEAGEKVLGAGLFFTGEVDAEAAVQARTIAELLGV